MRCSGSPRPAEPHEVEALLDYLESRFGVPRDALGPRSIFVSGDSYWIFSGDPGIPGDFPCSESVGIRALRPSGKGLKPTSAFLRIIGALATRNVVELAGEEDLLAFMTGGIVRGEFAADPGYVVVKFGGEVLGCGLHSPGLGIVSQLPSHMRASLNWGVFQE